eukprot:TRINITY_DN3505_c0_g2_i1.p1 TRINITY_DN3505_c0_g2~~TRINITY_DN3505_c0_g2_i1.p1  ORF type:complete len:408 (-),score=106.45 TRINITY_DN3505_c0_g2_i1:41-1264(-)
MVRTVLFLSPQFPANFCHFVSHLKEEGCVVVAIGDAPFDSLVDVLKADLTEYYEVPSMEDYDEVYRGVAHLIHHHGRLDWVQSHNEHWLSLEARIRQDFNIRTGYMPEEISQFQRKSVMKRMFRELGLNVPEGGVMSTPDEVCEFANRVGYPLIVKPDMGVGAMDTFKLKDEGEMRNFFNTTFIEHPQEYIFERFISGRLITFDGLADKRSHILVSGTLQYGAAIMECVSNANQDIYGYISRKVPEDLKEAGKKLVEAFKVRGHFFHFEFFRETNGRLVVLEVNLRLTGGKGIDMYNYAFDTDLYKMWAEVVVDKLELKPGMEPITDAKYFSCYASRRSHKMYQYTHDDLINKAAWSPEEQGVQVMWSFDVPELFRRAMGDFAYILRSPTEEALCHMLNDLFALKAC